MVQRFVAYVILAIGAVNSCYAFDLEVFQNSNQKPLILAAFIPDDEALNVKPKKLNVKLTKLNAKRLYVNVKQMQLKRNVKQMQLKRNVKQM